MYPQTDVEANRLMEQQRLGDESEVLDFVFASAHDDDFKDDDEFEDEDFELDEEEED